MTQKKLDTINPKFPFLWHGGDYNPDQWRHMPGTVDEDFRMFPLAHINSLSVGIFSWASLEPEEGRFEFGWLDDVMDRAAQQKMAVVLATPSGAKPNWMALKYPEVRRMHCGGLNGTLEARREAQHDRHNHCFTSPVYRRLAQRINHSLAERYKDHPALALWHVSNEVSGDCHCPLCKAAFRDWLKSRYGTLETLNQAWWTGFWAHAYGAWEEIDFIDSSLPAMVVDWKRFTSDQTVDFFKAETAPLREVTPGVPLTLNLMGFFEGVDYWKLAQVIDVVSWDSYPRYHTRPDNAATAAFISMTHDLNRSLGKGRPFLLMESSPSAVNWMPINRLLRPGQLRMKSLQAVAHGADSVQYFQIRKGRGGGEKLHGAVIDHVGHEHTRVFDEVAQVGTDLGKLCAVTGTAVPADVAVIYDWESVWALRASDGPSDVAKDCVGWARENYRPFWHRGVGVDIPNADCPFDGYKIVVAPSLYMVRPDFAERVEAFVAAGGTFVATFLTGIAGTSDLCHLGGWPGPLRRVLGIWAEEIDYLYADEANAIHCLEGNAAGIPAAAYAVRHVCDRMHAETATVVGTYASDFYAGEPALTVNRYGKGEAWYLAARAEAPLLDAFYAGLIARAGVRCALGCTLPDQVSATIRSDGVYDYVFVINTASEPRHVELGVRSLTDLLTGSTSSGTVELPPSGVKVFKRSAL